METTLIIKINMKTIRRIAAICEIELTPEQEAAITQGVEIGEDELAEMIDDKNVPLAMAIVLMTKAVKPKNQ